MLDIRQLFGPEVVNITFEEAIARGWLPKIEYHLLTDHSFDEAALAQITKDVMEGRGRLTLKELNRRLFVRTRDEEIARIIEGYNENTIIFCSTIEHADRFCGFLGSADTYHSHQTDERNRTVLDNLRRGLTKRVLAVDSFNEGIDVPEVGLVVFNRSTKSERIFRQQLGRGLRPVKNKLVVLDFVGNVERVAFLKEMSDRIVELQEQFLPPHDPGSRPTKPDSLHVSGAGFDFTFSDTVIPLMDIVRRISAQFYPTWEEAARATQVLKIKRAKEYLELYKKDPSLPSSPPQFYLDFPGWRFFLGRSHYRQVPKSRRYPTWEEAGAAAQRLGIHSKREYTLALPRDSRLTADPVSFYQDFPGWVRFLGKEKGGKRTRSLIYPTWQEASEAAKRLGLKTATQYREGGYLRDHRLPSEPKNSYPDFPGWETFLAKPGFYPTWQEAAGAARMLSITTGKEYKQRCKEDPRLPSDPQGRYSEFPGWKVYLGRSSFYGTWQEAGRAALGLGLSAASNYRPGYKADPHLPGSPEGVYPDFPGWTVFFGKKTRSQEFYRTWQQAGRAARALGITGDADYQRRYKEDPKLPSAPREVYKNFPGLRVFLGKIVCRPE